MSIVEYRLFKILPNGLIVYRRDKERAKFEAATRKSRKGTLLARIVEVMIQEPAYRRGDRKIRSVTRA